VAEEQRGVYNEISRAWGLVFDNMAAASGATNQSAKASGAMNNQFWSANQRFFSRTLISMMMPSIIAKADEDIAAGRSVVLQLVNTNDAPMQRNIKNLPAEDDLSWLDLSAKQVLLDYVDATFPIHAYTQVTDDQGNTTWVLATDSDGNPIIDPDALLLKEQTLDEVAGIDMPEGVLEQLLSHFGPDQLAEVTGRKARVFRTTDEGGTESIEKETKRTAQHVQADIAAFQAGRKHILVFSDAGGTGLSYHDDKNNPVSRRRAHYIIQPGWRSEAALQGLGRTHRSNQHTAPLYRLFGTNIKGHKRFIAALAKRLDSLGALSRGQREAGGQGIFNPSDNLETTYSSAAIRGLVMNLHQQTVDAFTMSEFEEWMHIQLLDDDGNVVESRIPPIGRFFNRLLQMTVERQDMVFDEFWQRMTERVEVARSRGELDTGIRTIHADIIQKETEEVIRVDSETGLETRLVRLKVMDKVELFSLVDAFGLARDAQARSHPHASPVRMVRQKRSGRTYLLSETHSVDEVTTGRIRKRYLRWSPHKRDPIFMDDVVTEGLDANYDVITEQREQKVNWEMEMRRAPRYHQAYVNLLTGALLPIWGQLPATQAKAAKAAITAQPSRLVPLKGEEKKEPDKQASVRAPAIRAEALIGLEIDDATVRELSKDMDLSAGDQSITPDAAVEGLLGGTVSIRLSNGWVVAQGRMLEQRYLFVNTPEWTDRQRLESIGVRFIRHGSKTRWYIPTADAIDVFPKLAAMAGGIHAVTDTSTGVMGSPMSAPSVRGSHSHRDLQQSRLSGASMTMSELRKRMEDVGRTPIFTGHGWFAQRRAGGWFDPRTQEIRVKSDSALKTMTHEFGHALHRVILGEGSLPTEGPVARELERMGVALYGARKPNDGYPAEGFAEFVAHYMMGMDMTAMAPATLAWWENEMLVERPELAKDWAKLSVMFEAWWKQGAIGRVAAHIWFPEKGKLGLWKRGLQRVGQLLLGRRAWINDAAALDDITARVATESGATTDDLPPGMNPAMTYAALSMTPRATAWTMVNKAMTNAYGDPIGPSLGEILHTFSKRGELEDFIVFTTAARGLLLAGRGIETGMTISDMNAVVEEMGERPDFVDGLAVLTNWSNQLMQYLVDAGGLSPASAQALRDANPIYVPFFRHFEQKRTGHGGGSGVTIANAPSGIRRIIGSGKRIVSWEIGLMQQAERIITLSNKIRITRSIIELSERVGGAAWFATKIQPPADATSFQMGEIHQQLVDAGVRFPTDQQRGESDFDYAARKKTKEWKKQHDALMDEMFTVYDQATQYKGGEPIVVFWRNGKREFWQLDPEVYEVVATMDHKHIPPWLALLAGPVKRMVHFGAVTGRLAFQAIKNPSRDISTWNIFEKNKPIPAEVLGPLYGVGMMLREIYAQATDDKMSNKLRALGKDMATLFGQDQAEARAGIDKALARGWEGKAGYVALHPLDAMRDILGAMEFAPRLHTFRLALAEGERRWGQGSYDSIIYALWQSRDVTLPFTRAGRISRWLNVMRPFFNANIQDASKFYRVFGNLNPFKKNVSWRERKHAMLATARAFTWLTLPTLGLWYINRDEPWYQEAPDWQKFAFWLVEIPGTGSLNETLYKKLVGRGMDEDEALEKATHGYVLKIPKPFILGNVFASLPELYTDWAYRGTGDTDALLDQVEGLIGASMPVQGPLDLLPSFARPWIEIATNHRGFQKNAVNPRWMTNRPPEQRFQPWTTETAKKLSEWMVASGLPVLRETTPLDIEHAMSALTGGMVLDAVQMTEQLAGWREPRPGPAGAPVFGTMFQPPPYANGKSMNALYEERKTLNYAKGRGNLTPEQVTRQRLVGAGIAQLNALRKRRQEASGEERFEIEAQMAATARAALGKSELPEAPTPPAMKQRIAGESFRSVFDRQARAIEETGDNLPREERLADMARATAAAKEQGADPIKAKKFAQRSLRTVYGKEMREAIKAGDIEESNRLDKVMQALGDRRLRDVWKEMKKQGQVPKRKRQPRTETPGTRRPKMSIGELIGRSRK